MLDRLFVPIVVLLLFAVIFIFLFFWKKEGVLKSTTIWYTFITFLLFSGIGALGAVVIKSGQAKTFHFLVFQFIFLLLATFHTWFLYKFYWSKRHPDKKEEDSIWPELFYTLFLSCFCTIGFVVVYALVNKDANAALLFSRAMLVFPLPFLSLKTFDFSQQIEERDFEHKWFFIQGEVDKKNIDWDEQAIIQFRMHKKFADQEKIIKPRKEPGGTRYAKDKTELGKIFAVCVQAKNINQAGTIQDLHTVSDNNPIWWLFKRKFVLWDTRTWGRRKYLNPTVSLQENELNNEDVIVAMRMLK